MYFAEIARTSVTKGLGPVGHRRVSKQKGWGGESAESADIQSTRERTYIGLGQSHMKCPVVSDTPREHCIHIGSLSW